MSLTNRKRTQPDQPKDVYPNKRSKNHPSNPKPPPTATFLSLPREIRQKILFEVFDGACDQDVAFMINLNMLAVVFTNSGPVQPPRVRAPHISDLASTLSLVHPTIHEDTGYVLEKQLAKMENFDDLWEFDESHKQKLRRWLRLRFRSALISHQPDDENSKYLSQFDSLIISTIFPEAGPWEDDVHPQ